MEILANLLLIYLALDVIFKWSTKNKKISMYINTIIFTIINGTIYDRVGSGSDYDVYRNGFQNILTTEIPDKELGFYYLNLLIKRVTDEYSIAFFIFILIVNFFIIKMIYKYSKNIEFSLLMYVIMGGYFTATNITRQFIALSIYTYSIQYLIDKKYIKYLIVGFIAAQFHITAIPIVIISLLVGMFNEIIFKHYLIYFVIINMTIIIEPLIRHIGMSLFYNQYESGTFFYGSNMLHYVVQLAFVLFYMINIKRVKNNETKFFINLATMASAFTLLSRNMVLYARFALFFNIFHIIAMINVMSEIEEKKEKRLLYYCIVVGLLVYYVLCTSKYFYIESYIIDYFIAPIYIN